MDKLDVVIAIQSCLIAVSLVLAWKAYSIVESFSDYKLMKAFAEVDKNVEHITEALKYVVMDIHSLGDCHNQLARSFKSIFERPAEEANEETKDEQKDNV